MGSLAVAGAKTGDGYIPVYPYDDGQDHGDLARIAIKEIDLRTAPRDGAPIIGKRYRDQIVHIYYELIPPDAPQFYNRLWYRVWGGYIHSAHIQRVSIRFNEPLSTIPETGQLVEVTVPYTPTYSLTPRDGWQVRDARPLYFETVHWATGIQTGPDGEPWYQLTSEIDDFLRYFVPARHLRPILPDEIAPISPTIPASKKHIKVSLPLQTLFAFEGDRLVYTARVSTGIPNPSLPRDEIPTATPKGVFNIYSKMPSKHMGMVTGNPDAEGGGGYSLPGVPWTMFFSPNGGVAFHGTYWHNNFGLQMSHGCVNMRNEDAKWLFRWTTPVFDPSKIKDHTDWEVTGNGTLVNIE